MLSRGSPYIGNPHVPSETDLGCCAAPERRVDADSPPQRRQQPVPPRPPQTARMYIDPATTTRGTFSASPQQSLAAQNAARIACGRMSTQAWAQPAGGSDGAISAGLTPANSCAQATALGMRRQRRWTSHGWDEHGGAAEARRSHPAWHPLRHGPTTHTSAFDKVSSPSSPSNTKHCSSSR